MLATAVLAVTMPDQFVGTLKNINSALEGATEALKNVHYTDKSETYIPVHCDVAASVGELTTEELKLMDGHLLACVAGINKEFAQHGVGHKSDWDLVMQFMMKSLFLNLDQSSVVHKQDGYDISEDNFWKSDGSAEDHKVKAFSSWLNGFINDEDVFKESTQHIDFGELANIIAQTGTRVVDAATFFHRVEDHERKVVDIGILRYPDHNHQYIKVYRLQLTVWSHCERTLMVQKDRNGVRGVFDSKIFRPRKEVLDKWNQEALEAAIDEGQKYFLKKK